MTPEQRAREYRELKRIEKAKAEKRKKAGVKADLTENVPQGYGDRAATAAESAAAAVGWSGKTAEKAADVVDKIDELEEHGAFKLLLGRRYNRRKKAHGGDRKSKAQIEPLIENTAEAIAEQHGVSRETVKRAGKFAEAVAADPELARKRYG